MINEKLLKKSMVGKDFLRLGTAPTDINIWLDYRLSIMQMKEAKKYPSVWLDNELLAIDHIIEIING